MQNIQTAHTAQEKKRQEKNGQKNKIHISPKSEWKSLSHVQLFLTPRTVAHQVHGILHSSMLEWVAISFSRESSQSRDQTQEPSIVGGFFSIWATREAQRRHTNGKWHIKWCSTLLISSSKILQIINAGESVKKRESCYILYGNVNWCNHYGKKYRDFFKN